MEHLLKIAALVLFLLSPTLLLYSPQPAHAFALEWPPGLAPGPYAVGFRTIESYDASRTFGEARDYFGLPLPGETARPLQVCIWYPAEPFDPGARMVFGEYVFPYPSDERPFAFLSELQDREVRNLQWLLRGDQGRVLDLLSYEVGAARDAAPAPGTFPLVLFAGARGHGMPAQSVLCEYLASFGFLVAATHSVGTTVSTPLADVRDLETAARDTEYALALLGGQADADRDRVALVGAGLGGQAALVVAMRHTGIRAAGVIDVDTSAGPLAAHPSYDPVRARLPILCVRPDRAAGCDSLLEHGLVHADRTTCTLETDDPLSLSVYGLIAQGESESDGPLSGRAAGVYADLCRRLRAFLALHLEDDTAAVATVQAPRSVHWPGVEPPPTAPQFRQIIDDRGPQAAAEFFDRFDLANRPPLLPEVELNMLGYRYLQTGRAADAVAALRMCAAWYPQSANAWDSYGEAATAHGDRETARRCFLKVQETLPADGALNDAARAQLAERAAAALQQLDSEHE